MEIKLIELYCLICHFYNTQSVLKEQRVCNFKPVFTDQELVTGYFLAMLNNRQTKQEIYQYLDLHWRKWFPHLPSYQAFSYRLNNLAADFAVLSNLLIHAKLDSLPHNLSADSLIDSFPVMLKKGSQAKVCRTASEIADFGYCSSKNLYYYGVKLHSLAIRRLKTLPLPFCLFLSEASKHDLTAFKQHNPPVPTPNLFADKAYQDQALKQLLAHQGIVLLTPYKKKRNDLPPLNEPLWSRFVSSFRQPIESFFKWLNDKTDFQNASRVRSTKGLLVHCYGKLAFACLLLCFYS